MDIKKLEEKNNSTQLLLKGTDIAFMNALRRTITNTVPTLAVEDVSIYENASVLFDEFLANRLALIPLKTDLKRYNTEGDQVKLILEKEGPGMVYSQDIKSTDPKIDVVDKKIPIVKLKKGDKIKLEMTAVLGKGKNHAKWQPAVVGYKQLPSIIVGKECKLCKKCVENCPTNVLEIKAKRVVLKDPFNCILCGKCRDTCNAHALELEYSDNSFVMNIESHGGLEVKEIMLKASEMLKEKIKEFKKEIKEL